jgi:aminopeptidase
MDPRITKLAEILVQYSIGVRKGDKVAIRGDVVAIDLVNQLLCGVLRAGGHPVVLLTSDRFQETFFEHADAAQLDWASPVEKVIHQDMDAIIYARGASNTRLLSGVDPEKQARFQQTQRPFHELRMARSAEGSLRWVVTQFPCSAYAQEADMSLAEYEDFVYRATFADRQDPLADWNAVHAMQQRLIDWLDGREHVRVQGPDIDLSMSIKGRRFMNSDGRRNMPSGEIYTGPVEESVNGWVRFSYPAIRGGREVEGVAFQFEAGRVVKATARKNEAYLLSQLDSDEGARYLGEFAFGTNEGIQRFTKNILFDEKIAGTLHMAVGSGYPETGSRNRSALHWDFICDVRQDSEIHVDGELFYKNGAFQI